jgi:hypothetical protein
MTDFWLIFFRDPSTGAVIGHLTRHNCIADCRGNPYFIGMKKIEVNLDELEK